MTRWRRAEPLPPALRRLLDRHERVLAAATVGGEAGVVLATQLGLWVPGDSGSWRRIGWNEVVKASWTDDGLDIVEGVVDDEGLVSDRVPMLLRLADAGPLPSVVRKRVESSIARSEQVRVPGGTGRIVARRVPGRDGLLWTARIDTGTPATPQARHTLAGQLGQVIASSADIGET